MTRVYDKELAEVAVFMDRSGRSAAYAEFQSVIKEKLAELARQPNWISKISEVVSRADRAPHDPIKSRKKIALKLRKWRIDAAKDPLKKVRSEEIRISDIHDIAGVTVVCPYPSDVKLVKDAIVGLSDPRFSVSLPRLIASPDYNAFHFVMEGNGKYLNLKCEAQIKTAFTQSWGLKIHDLIYKPPGDIDARLHAHISKIGQMLSILDEQSEILKTLIEEAWSLDVKRRYVAQKTLLSGVAFDASPGLKKILEKWDANQNLIATAPVSGEIIADMDNELSSFAGAGPLSQDFCRVVCLYALSRANRDRNDFALSYVDSWISSLNPGGDDYKRGLVFQCNALMAMGEYEECLVLAQKVIQIAEADPVNTDPLLNARLNWAYYLSEAFYHRAFDEPTGAGKRDTYETDECRRNALEIVNSLKIQIDGSPKRNQLQDTVGAVLIACGNTGAEVREGLELCRAALIKTSETHDRQLMESFFALHENRAYKRLVSLE